MQDLWGEIRSALSLREWDTVFALSKDDEDLFRYVCDHVCRQDESLASIFKAGSCLEGVEKGDILPSNLVEAMAMPLHRRFGYASFGRSLFPVESLPDGAAPLYAGDISDGEAE